MCIDGKDINSKHARMHGMGVCKQSQPRMHVHLCALAFRVSSLSCIRYESVSYIPSAPIIAIRPEGIEGSPLLCIPLAQTDTVSEEI